MKRVGGLCIVLFGAAGLFAQGHAGTAARGGVSGARAGGVATRPAPPIPGVPARPPSILYPASGTPQHVAPGFGRNSGASVFYYPVYVPYGGYSGYSGYDNSYAAPAPGPDPSYYQQPNMNMMYAPPAYPMYPPPETARSRTDINPYVAQDDGPPPMQTDDSASKHYLIALKDHTVYAAIAYWIDGDTVHYFTAGNVHNQTSLSLIDRDLTERLNKESGQQVILPAQK